MPSVVLEWLAEHWSVGQKTIPEYADVVVMATMAATPHGLTLGSAEIVKYSRGLLSRYPNARAVFGVYAYSVDPVIEILEKQQLLPPGRCVYTGEVRNTDHEATQAAAAAPEAKHVVAVTDEWHSRSFALGLHRAYRALGKQPKITVLAISPLHVLGVHNPILALRSHWKWACANVLRHLFMRFVPFSRKIMLETNLIRQPGAER